MPLPEGFANGAMSTSGDSWATTASDPSKLNPLSAAGTSVRNGAPRSEVSDDGPKSNMS